MKRIAGAGILIIGIVILLVGLSAPATNTQTAVTCVDSTWDAADGCVESTYSTPNYGKGILIMMGLMATMVGGGVIAFSSSGDNITPSSGGKPGEVDGLKELSLEEQFRQRQERLESKHSSSGGEPGEVDGSKGPSLEEQFRQRRERLESED